MEMEWEGPLYRTTRVRRAGAVMEVAGLSRLFSVRNGREEYTGLLVQSRRG